MRRPRARALCSKTSRALLASEISCSRSKVAVPASAGSSPAPSPTSRIKPARSSSATEISFCRRATSASSSARTVASSLVVHGFSFSRTRRCCGSALGLEAKLAPRPLDPAVVLVALAALALAAGLLAVTLGALALVVALVAVTFAAGLLAVTFGALAFVVGAFLVAALLGAAFFGGTPLLAAEVIFFTAMLGPFMMALLRPHENTVMCA